MPVIVRTGPSVFPGSRAEAGDPGLLGTIVADYPGVPFVLAHGGRGHWYADAAAARAGPGPNVWIDLAGLPPKRLPGYYTGFDLPALAAKLDLGTDWPGVPGVARNAAPSRRSASPATSSPACVRGNARRVYLRGLTARRPRDHSQRMAAAPEAPLPSGRH